eukprot:gene193-biopygen3864
MFAAAVRVPGLQRLSPEAPDPRRERRDDDAPCRRMGPPLQTARPLTVGDRCGRPITMSPAALRRLFAVPATGPRRSLRAAGLRVIPLETRQVYILQTPPVRPHVGALRPPRGRVGPVRPLLQRGVGQHPFIASVRGGLLRGHSGVRGCGRIDHRVGIVSGRRIGSSRASSLLRHAPPPPPPPKPQRRPNPVYLKREVTPRAARTAGAPPSTTCVGVESAPPARINK